MRSGGRVLVELYPGGRFHLRRNYPFNVAVVLYQTAKPKSRPSGEILLFVAGRACRFFIKPGHFHGQRLKLLIVIVFGHGSLTFPEMRNG